MIVPKFPVIALLVVAFVVEALRVAKLAVVPQIVDNNVLVKLAKVANIPTEVEVAEVYEFV